jgi:hypothetical protein
MADPSLWLIVGRIGIAALQPTMPAAAKRSWQAQTQRTARPSRAINIPGILRIDVYQ